MKRMPSIALVAGGLFVALIACSFWIGNTSSPQRVSYSAFEKNLADGQIRSATVSGEDIQATLRDGRVIATTRIANDLGDAIRGARRRGNGVSGGG